MINCIDLFAGCGGLSEGFEMSESFKVHAFVEWEKRPCETLAHRLSTKWGYEDAKERVMRFDIQRTDELLEGWQDEEYGYNQGLDKLLGDTQIDAVIGGPPCQAYSIAGRVRDKNGMEDDYRNFLFESYLKVVDHLRPKVFVFENVEGILSAKPGGVSILTRIRERLSELNFEIISNLRGTALVNASDFGVPQSRKRVIIIGVNKDKIKTNPQKALFHFYNTILPSYRVLDKVTVDNAISDLPKLYPLEEEIKNEGRKFSHDYTCNEILNHIPRFHSKRDQEIFAELALDKIEGTNKYPDSKSLIDLYYRKTGKTTNVHKYNVLEGNKISNTIPAHLYKDGLRHIHPDYKQARSITVREAARLQSFPDDFEFLGSMGDQYKMIGNAVPPRLSEVVSRAVEIFIKENF